MKYFVLLAALLSFTAVDRLSIDSQERVLRAVATFYGIQL